MSKAKFAAAKELIEEKNYEAARSVLDTIDDPLAKQWLQKLDRIAPAFPAVGAKGREEQDRYYRGRNRDRRWWRIGNGLRLIGGSVVSFVLFAFLAYPKIAHSNGSIHLGIESCFLPIGLVMLVSGFVFIFKD